MEDEDVGVIPDGAETELSEVRHNDEERRAGMPSATATHVVESECALGPSHLAAMRAQ